MHVAEETDPLRDTRARGLQQLRILLPEQGEHQTAADARCDDCGAPELREADDLDAQPIAEARARGEGEARLRETVRAEAGKDLGASQREAGAHGGGAHLTAAEGRVGQQVPRQRQPRARQRTVHEPRHVDHGNTLRTRHKPAHLT